MPNLKYVFIVNDNDNRALRFLSQFKYKNKNLNFDTNKPFNDINLNGLINYRNYYYANSHLFFDNCSFGNTNDISGKMFANQLSALLLRFCENKNLKIQRVFFRITNYTGKKETIDNLLIQYESKEAKETRQNATGDKSSVSINFMNFGRTIVLNECFIDSRYTMFGNNISHEAINCFKTDNLERYLYLCSSGVLKRDRFFKNNAEEKTLPVQYIDENKITYLDYSKTGKDEEKNVQYIFLRKVDRVEALDFAFDDKLAPEKYLDINYNHQNIIYIFNANSYSSNINDDSLQDTVHKSEDSAVKVYASFKADNDSCFVPTNNAIVSNEDGLDKLKGSTMHQFVIEGSTFYDRLCTKINSITWEHEEVPTVGEYLESDNFIEDNIPDTILGIVDRLNRETFYSDLIAYVFSKSPAILNAFFGKCGIDKRVDSGSYEVERENKNIDILIKNNRRDNQFIVVLENKISANFSQDELKTWDSFINKKNAKKHIVEEIETEKEGYVRRNPDKKMNCQLPKYYLLAKYIAKSNELPSDDNHIKCLIICPEQYVGSYASGKEEYGYGEKYLVKSYKLISEAISEVLDYNLDSNLENYEIELIKEIQRSLSVHITKANVLFILRNRHRFVRSIIALNRARETDD